MKDYLKVLVLTLVLLTTFLICDPQKFVIGYRLTGMPWTPVTYTQAQMDGRLSVNADTLILGTEFVGVRACNLLGCSEDSYFVFPRNIKGMYWIK